MDVASFRYAHGFPQSFLVVKVKHFELVALSQMVQMLNWVCSNSVFRFAGFKNRHANSFQTQFFLAFGKIPNLKHFPNGKGLFRWHSLNAFPYQDFDLRAGGPKLLGRERGTVRLQDLEELTLKMRKKCQAHEELQRCCVGNICLVMNW